MQLVFNTTKNMIHAVAESFQLPPTDIPAIVCGDFNATPGSALISGLCKESSVKVNNSDRPTISGQWQYQSRSCKTVHIGQHSFGKEQLCVEVPYEYKTSPNKVVPKTYGHSLGRLKSAYAEVHASIVTAAAIRQYQFVKNGPRYRLVKASGAAALGERKGKREGEGDEGEEEEAGEGEGETATSVKSGGDKPSLTLEPAITQYHLTGGCGVDYILYTGSTLQVDGVYEMLDYTKIHQASYGTKGFCTNSLPNKWWGSDHMSLIADFSFLQQPVRCSDNEKDISGTPVSCK